MQWFGGRESDNVEEGSSSGGRGFAVGGGILGFIGLLIYLFTGVNPTQLFSGGTTDSTQQNTQVVNNGPEGSQKRFARIILAGTEDVWDSLFNAMNLKYSHPTLHLYSGGVDAGCGFATSATGPFYCPQDRKVYLDTSFFVDMQQRFQAPGAAAAAYVIAHEVGHHVQNLLGISAKMDEARSRLSQTEFNKLSVKLELQADFYAGVWAHYEALNHQNNIIINRQDIDSALVAAHAIGDDRLQQKYQGHVEPDSFTHGTSAQRAYWFKKGFDTGDIKQGNTFAEADLADEQP